MGNEFVATNAAIAAAGIASLLNKNADIKANFTVAVADNTSTIAAENGLEFTTKAGGTDAMQVSAINITQTKKTDGTVTYTDNAVKATPSEDAYQSIDNQSENL